MSGEFQDGRGKSLEKNKRSGGASYGICLVRGNTDLSLSASSLILYFIAGRNWCGKVAEFVSSGKRKLSIKRCRGPTGSKATSSCRFLAPLS